MKRKLLLVLSVCMMFVLMACGEAEQEETEGSGEAAAQETEGSGEEASSGSEEEAQGMTLEGPVEIEFWHAMSGGHEESLKAITEAFENEYSDVSVTLVNQGGYDELSQNIMAGARANRLPTISQAYEDWVTEYIEQDFVTSLNPYIEDQNIGMSDEELEDIVTVFREANKWDNDYYSLPFNKSTRILFYNADMLEENDLDPPTTWEELREAAEILTGDGVVGMGFENAVGLEISNYIHQAGGEFVDEETMEVRFNSREGMEAVSFIREMLDEDIARLAGEDGYMSGPFGRGDVGMYVGSSAGIPFVASSAEGNIEWSATVLPKGEEAATNFAGTNVTLFDNASDQEKIAAWKYMKFLINTENTAQWAMDTGYLPIRYSALELEDYEAFKEENPAQGVGEQQFEHGFFDARILGAYSMKNAVAEEMEAVFGGQKSVEEGLREAERRAKEEIERANQ